MRFEPPPASQAYDRSNEGSFRSLLRQFLTGVLRGDRDVELQPAVRFILTSPNGTRWAISINNSGVLTSTAL